jgi:hypothetical protein
MGVIRGEAGVGKTFAVEHATETTQVAAHWFTFPKQPAITHIVKAMLEEITGVPHRAERFKLTSDLLAVLAEKPRLIVVDEAQQLNADAFDYLRFLHDDPDTQFALMFVGGNGCWKTLSRFPMLLSRIFRAIEVKSLEEEEVLTLMPQFHTIHAKARAETLLWVDATFAQGNFRRWASFTRTVADVCRDLGVKTYDEKVAHAALSLFCRTGMCSVLPEPGLFVVFDPQDAPERTAFLRRLNGNDHGRVVAEVRPGARNLSWVAAAILEGLGKDLNAGGTGRNAARNWRRASDLLIGTGTTDLFVSRVQSLSSAEWESLVELAAEVGARLWLVIQQSHLRRTHEEVTQAWPFASLPWEQFEQQWETASAAEDAVEARAATTPEPFPQVPDDDFTTFLDTCGRVLKRSAAKRVDSAFERGRALAATIAKADGGSGWQSSVRELLDDPSNLPEAVARVRGAQAALFLDGLWLRLDQRLFALRWESQAQLELTPALAAAINRYASTQWAALAALRALTQAGVVEHAEARLGDVSDTTIRIGGREHPLGQVSRHVFAQVAARARDGAGDADPLFTKEGSSAGTAEEREPLRMRGVQRILRAVGDEIRVELIERKSSWNPEDDAEWARRRGLVLRPLDEVTS